jgi:hypothetical protein
MGKRDIRTAVEARIDLGYSRQHAFDEMRLEKPELAPKRLAHVVRYVPSLAARQKYRVEQEVLLGMIAASAVLRFIHAPVIFQGQAVDAKAILLTVPIASIAMGIGIFRYHAQLYRWLGSLSVYGIFRGMGRAHSRRWQSFPGTWSTRDVIATDLSLGHELAAARDRRIVRGGFHHLPWKSAKRLRT